MTSYFYEAVDSAGSRTNGVMDVATQGEALRRIKEMGLFPTRVAERRRQKDRAGRQQAKSFGGIRNVSISIPFLSGRVKPAAICVFTRQLATLVDAGMPLLRGLRILHEQEANKVLRRITAELATTIESGSSLSEAMAAYPRVFNRLYINMVRAGEASGALDLTLRRLAELIEKAQKIKGKVMTAMFYPAAVMFVAFAILMLMTVFVIPRFKAIFEGLVSGQTLPSFTLFVFGISDFVKNRYLVVGGILFAAFILFTLTVKTKWGRHLFDRFKLRMPVLGKVFRKAAISRFTRTLGTLLGSGVPILQALNIVRETAGNVVLSNVVSKVHDSVKEGETVTSPLKASGVFPPFMVGMVDVGEQTGALPNMLLKIADNCDEDVDNAVSAMTSLLEPIMIVFLAVIVGSIVIALFYPLILAGGGIDSQGQDM